MKMMFRGRCVGRISGDVFERLVRSEHILRFPRPALAMHEALLAELDQRGVRWIKAELPDGQIIVASLDAYRDGTPINRGHGPQRIVLLSDHAVMIQAAASGVSADLGGKL